MARKRKYNKTLGNVHAKVFKRPCGRPRKYKLDIPISQPLRRRGRPRIIPIEHQSPKPEPTNTQEPFKDLGIPGKYLNLFKSQPLELPGSRIKRRKLSKRGSRCNFH